MIPKLIRLLQADVAEDSPPRRIGDLVYHHLLELVGPTDAPDRVDRVTVKIQDHLLALRRQCHEDETDCWFAFNSRSVDYIQGPCFVEPQDPPEVQLAKQNRLKASSLRRALEALNFNQFETLSAALLSILGVRKVSLTRRAADQGIDFFGQLVLADVEATGVPFFGLTHRIRFWLIGQSKHYVGNKVSSPEVRNLVGSINLARFKEYASTSDLLERLPLRSCDPIFALLATTGTFTRDAQRLAGNSGVILLDVDDISKFLADKGVAIQGASDDELSTQLAAWAETVQMKQYGEAGGGTLRA